MKVKNHISSKELFFVLVHTMVGIEILQLPYKLNHEVNSDGWITILLTGLMILFIVLIIWFLCSKFPNLTLYDFSKKVLGKIPGSLLNFIYIIYFLIVVSYVFIVFAETLKRWVLPETPAFVLLLVGILMLIYGGICTIRNMVALFSFMFIFIIILFFLIVFVFHDTAMDIRYLFPLGSNGIWNIFKGTNEAFLSFLGFETLLIYYAFMKQPKKIKAMKGAIAAVLFVTLSFMLIVAFTTIILSPQELKHTPQPVIYVLSTSSMRLISRLDLIFLSVWILVIFTTVISYTYSASMGISKLIQVKHKISVCLFAIFVFTISMLFYYMELPVPENGLKIISFIFGFIFPIILLAITLIFKKGVSLDEKN